MRHRHPVNEQRRGDSPRKEPSVMRAVLRTLLIVEMVVCFGPMTILLMMGALLVPIQVMALVWEPLLWEGPVEVIGLVLSGSIGLVTLIVLLDKVFDETATVRRPWLVLAGAVVGMLALIEPLTSSSGVWRALAAMPLIAGLHVLYLSRRMFFPWASKS
jgi:hypothetical protein